MTNLRLERQEEAVYSAVARCQGSSKKGVPGALALRRGQIVTTELFVLSVFSV